VNWKRLLPSDKKTWIAIVVVVGVLAYNIPKSWQQDRELESDAGEAIGTVVNVYRSGRSNLVTVFEFDVNDNTYTVSSSSDWFKDCIGTKWCIGEQRMIRYWRPHPERAKVMWDKPAPETNEMAP